MVGAGVFVAFAPAAAAAGTSLLIGLGIAAVVAYCNATSSAQLAAVYPTSGGTYVYGRERLGPWWGYLAGWGFVAGKTASCAAMAMTFAAYVAPAAWRKPAAFAAVVALTAVNYRGVTRTARAARLLLGLVLAVLALVVAAGVAGLISGAGAAGAAVFVSETDRQAYGILQSAGLLFFAFAGYARIATMGEEVAEPKRTIPRAIVGALGVAVLLYAAVALSALTVLGPSRLAASAAPLADTVRYAGWGWGTGIVRIGAAAAALGALLALIAGVSRTGLAMARERDLPAWLSAVHPRFRVPHHAGLALAVAVSALVLTVDLRNAIGFSSFGVLVYYFIANASALTQPRDQRRYPRAVAALGCAGCAALAATLPLGSVLAGAAVLALGMAGRAALRKGKAGGHNEGTPA